MDKYLLKIIIFIRFCCFLLLGYHSFNNDSVRTLEFVNLVTLATVLIIEFKIDMKKKKEV